MHISEFPPEILKEIFCYLYNIQLTKDAEIDAMQAEFRVWHKLCFEHSENFRAKMNLFFSELNLMQTIKVKKTTMTMLDPYIKERGLNAQIYAENPEMQFYWQQVSQNTKAIKNTEALFYRQNHTNFNILEPVFCFTNLVHLTTTGCVHAADILKLPSLKQLQVQQIFSEHYTEVFENIEELVLTTSISDLPAKPGSRMIDIPYAKMFPNIQLLHIICSSSYHNTDNFELSNMHLLRSLKIVLNDFFGTKILLGKMDNLEELILANFMYVSFVPETFYPKMLRFNIECYPACILLENFQAPQGLTISLDIHTVDVFNDSDMGVLERLGQKYNLRGTFINEDGFWTPMGSWNVREFCDFDPEQLEAFELSNGELLPKIINLSIAPKNLEKIETVQEDQQIDDQAAVDQEPIPTVNIEDLEDEIVYDLEMIEMIKPKEKLLQLLEKTTSLQKLILPDSEESFSEEVMRIVVTINQVQIYRSTDKTIELFCRIHEEVSKENPTKICTMFKCDKANGTLSKYCKNSGLIYKRGAVSIF
jgi:hypothetical protein